MSLSASASNTGDVPLQNLRIENIYPSELANAVQGETPQQTTLAIGESNIHLFNTANICGSDIDCGTSEKCLNNLCLIEIGDFVGEIAFGFTLKGDFSNALGDISTTTTNVNLPIIFEPENVIFRTNVKQDLGAVRYNGLHPEEDTSDGNLRWIAFDTDGDEILEKYGIGGGATSSSASCDHASYNVLLFIDYEGSKTADVWIIELATHPNEIGICRLKPLSGSDTIWYTEGATGSELAVTFAEPLEPYTSQNCGGTIPCQERYILRVNPPLETCNDNAKNQDETDIDCGGTICNKCEYFESCVENTDCLSNLCSGGTCAIADYVNFRTTTLDYWSESSSAIAFTDTCQQGLTTYGRESNSHQSYGRCEEYLYISDCTSKLGTVSCLLAENLIGNVANPDTPSAKGDGNWKLYLDDSDADNSEVWLCQNDEDGVGETLIRYDSVDPDADLISDEESFDFSLSPLKQMIC